MLRRHCTTPVLVRLLVIKELLVMAIVHASVTDHDREEELLSRGTHSVRGLLLSAVTKDHVDESHFCGSFMERLSMAFLVLKCFWFLLDWFFCGSFMERLYMFCLFLLDWLSCVLKLVYISV
jgi:hypothetical protein